jgi:hypothetical protein
VAEAVSSDPSEPRAHFSTVSRRHTGLPFQQAWDLKPVVAFAVRSSINGRFAISGAGTVTYVLMPARMRPECSMWFKSLRGRSRASVIGLSLATAVLLRPAALLAEVTSDPISVNVDQAKLIKLPGHIATIVVGNPLIADVTLQPGGLVVVTGKGYGATNVIAMDRAGTILVDRLIQVEGPSDRVVTVYRGVERESYSCMPICEKRVTLGDSAPYFKATMEQASNLSSQAGGAPTK